MKKYIDKKKYLFKYDFIVNLILPFFKICIFLNIIFLFSKYNSINKISNLCFNLQDAKVQKNINMTFHNIIHHKNRINIAIYTHCIKNGGRARVTALLLKYLYRIKIFNLFLFTRIFKEDNEYIFPEDIKRVIIKKDLIKAIKKNKIEVLIYELDEIKDILFLNHFTEAKIIFYHHSSTFDWLYENYIIFKKIYKSFYDSKYLISIVPFENDYLFKKWGIRSLLLDNFITYEFKSVIQTDLTSKIIIMLGRANSKKKRFILGMQSMEYIVKEIPECELKIISNRTGINAQEYFVENTNLENSIKFIGYIAAPEIILKNASLSFFPSVTEAFPMVLVETKIYGIPNILLGLDYISISKGGTVIIYDDKPESLAKEAIIILKIKEYKRRLSLEARNSMMQFNNEILLSKWVKLILCVYNDDDDEDCYINLREEKKKMNEKHALKIIENQLNLLRKRNHQFLNVSSKNYENYTWMEEIKLK